MTFRIGHLAYRLIRQMALTHARAPVYTEGGNFFDKDEELFMEKFFKSAGKRLPIAANQNHPGSQISSTKNRRASLLRAGQASLILMASISIFFIIRFLPHRPSAKGGTEMMDISTAELLEQINPSSGYRLQIQPGDLGPQLISYGVIDYEKFSQVYASAGQLLTPEQQSILIHGGSQELTINRENARFLLNFFWALGLANYNPILLNGPMTQLGWEKIGGFASTAGWTLGSRPGVEFYSQFDLIHISPDQQARLEHVSMNVFRPCCNNPAHFPDCNHGMAMLGLLTLMAANDASEAEMFEAAKYANAFWFPQQYLVLAAYFNLVQDTTFSEIAPQKVVGAKFSSGSGYQKTLGLISPNQGINPEQGSTINCGA